MMDAKQAVVQAKRSAADILGVSDASLEEIERESYQGRESWSITLGFPPKLDQAAPIEHLVASLQNLLDYKRFLIDAETGEFPAMKLRELAIR